MPTHLQEREDQLIGGHLEAKELKGGALYYLVIEWKEEDANGKKVRKPKWISTAPH